MPDTFDIEIFAVGKWNDLKFTAEDLNDFVTNFYKLKPVQQVPLKLGHNEKQPLKSADGQPSLGWAEELKVVGNKLIATVANVPKIIQKALKHKLYRKVSIEAMFDVKHKGAMHKNVLDAIALLGVDAPAVNVLDDLDAYMSRKFSLEGDRQIFTYETGGIPMDELKVLSDKVDALTENFTTLQEENKTLSEEKAKLEAEVAQFKADKEKDEADKKAETLTKKREEITALFDRAIEEEKITPAKREMYSKMIGLDDDEKVLGIDSADVKSMLDLEDKKSNEDTAANKNKFKRVHKDAGAELNRLANELEQEKKIPFSAALNIVIERHPDLAQEHYGVEE